MANSVGYTVADLLVRIQEAIDTLQYPLARAFCKRALELEPDNVEALELAGQVDIEMGDLREAKEVRRYCASLSGVVRAEDLRRELKNRG